MPCFIRQIRRQRIKIPDNVSLFNKKDAKRIEEDLKSRLSVETHEELHQKIDEYEAQERQEELREIIEDVLNEISEEKKEEAEGPPDRFKEERRKWKEMQQRAVAQ